MKLTKEEQKERNRQNYLANKQAYKDRAKAWRLLNPEKHKESSKKTNRKRRYNLTDEQLLQMYNLQKGCCKICSEFIELDSVKRHSNTANIDHNHVTNVVRGLLCGSCNVGIGMFKDNPDRLMNAIKYLNATDQRDS